MAQTPAPVTLTERQRSILVQLFDSWFHRMPAPSIHELTRSFRLKSTNSISLDLASLMGAGLVERWAFGASRSLRLTERGMCAAAQCMGSEELDIYARSLVGSLREAAEAAKAYEAWKAERLAEWESA